MHIDPKSRIPIYEQISTQIRERIASGVYAAGESLPSLRSLAVEIGVNPNTVQRAYEELERRGIVESRRGVGIFVRDQDATKRLKRAEKQLANAFKTTVETCIDKGLCPTHIRELFESALASRLEAARKL